MTKIYRQCELSTPMGISLWVTRRKAGPRWFRVTRNGASQSIWPESELRKFVADGTMREITHAEALDLLADWPEGHSELTAILADGSETENAITPSERIA